MRQRSNTLELIRLDAILIHIKTLSLVKSYFV